MKVRDTDCLPSPDLELPRDFQRAASQSGVTGGGDAPIKIIGFHPGIKETEWVAKTEGAGAFLFDEALADEVLDDARDETRTGLRAVNQLALNPNPIAVRQESADDAGTFTYEDISRLQLEAEIAAWQGATVHEDTGQSDVGVAVEIDGRQSFLAAEIQNARQELGHDEQWWIWVFPAGKPGLQLGYAEFQEV